MPPAAPRDLVNYIGERTTVELAQLPVEQVRLGQWCWNRTNTRPEIYDGTHWVPFCGGLIGDEAERPDAYHHMHALIDDENVCSGSPSQRRVISDEHGRKMTLWISSELAYFLTVEANPDVVEDDQRSVHLYNLTFEMVDEGEATPITPSGDACMTIQNETIHILFTSLKEANINLYDSYFSASSIPDKPNAPTTGQITIVMPCERVNQVSEVDQPCSHPSVAASAKLVNGAPTVVVAYTQLDDGGAVSNIVVQDYDPTVVWGTRYTTVPAVIISDPTANADFATVECSANNVAETSWMNHVAYVMASLAGPWRLHYAVETLAAGWVIGATPVDSGFYHINAQDTNLDLSAPSMVVHIDPINGPMVSVAIQDMTTDSTLIFVFNFTPDIVAGVPTVFSDEAVDIFDSVRQRNGYLWTDVGEEEEAYIRTYQLGISQIRDGPPVIYLYKYMNSDLGRSGVTLVDFVLMYRVGYVEDVHYIEPWANVPLKNNVGITFFPPKVHFAFYAYNRAWRSAREEPYYPYNVAVQANFALVTPLEPGPPLPVFTYNMIAKDIPAYPFEPTP